MSRLLSLLVSLRSNRRAVTSLEYAIIAVVIVVLGLVGVRSLAPEISTRFTAVGSALT